MAPRVKNKRCPLQEECGKKCEYVNKELECTYYYNNAGGDSVIDDQEDLRERLNQAKVRAHEEELINNMKVDEDPIEDPEEVATSLSATLSKGELSKMAMVRSIGLGYILPSQDNFFAVEDDITDLAEDIKLNGLLSPLTVCPASEENFYRLISGHRRYKALCSIYDNSFEVPCLVTAPVSPEAEAYMLIQANMSSRVLNWQESEKARQKVEEILLKLKAQGVEFPGKTRAHVAKLLKISEAQIAKNKYVSEHLIKELQDVPDDRMSFDDRYKISHWSDDFQNKFYKRYVKDKTSKIWGSNVNVYDSRIKKGEDPFAPKPDTERRKFCYHRQGCCTNEEAFKEIKEKELTFSAPGITFTCSSYCCCWCTYRYICPKRCEYTSNKVDEDDQENAAEYIYTTRSRFVLKNMLVEKGFDLKKIDSIVEEKNYEYSDNPRDLFTYPLDCNLHLNDFLFYLSILEITPNEFLNKVKKECNYLEELFEGEDSFEKPNWNIYLGEDGESK